MASISVNVTADMFFEAHGGAGIIGPEPGGDSSGWTVNIPGYPPCICDTFEDAAAMLREHVAKATKVAKGKREHR